MEVRWSNDKGNMVGHTRKGNTYQIVDRVIYKVWHERRWAARMKQYKKAKLRTKDRVVEYQPTGRSLWGTWPEEWPPFKRHWFVWPQMWSHFWNLPKMVILTDWWKVLQNQSHLGIGSDLHLAWEFWLWEIYLYVGRGTWSFQTGRLAQNYQRR